MTSYFCRAPQKAGYQPLPHHIAKMVARWQHPMRGLDDRLTLASSFFMAWMHNENQHEQSTWVSTHGHTR